MTRAKFTPFNQRRHSAVEGIFVEWINGGAGAHILAPLPGDPHRVVRVWGQDGIIELEMETIKAGTEIKVGEVAEEQFPYEISYKGMSLEDAKQYLKNRYKESIFGMTWEEVQRRQQGL